MNDSNPSNNPLTNGISRIYGYREDMDALMVTTAGVMSDVVKEIPAGVQKSVGHVTILDIEDADRSTVTDWCDKYLGNYFLFKSSEDNYHVIEPRIRSLAEVTELKKKSPVDDNLHRRIGWDYGTLTVRVGEKGFKARPELVEERKSLKLHDKPYSAPHLKFIEENYNSDLAGTLLEAHETRGQTLKFVVYGTYQKNGDR